MITYGVEYTDTFSGEANYSWVRRETISLPDNASRLVIMRKAKAAMGLSGVRGRSTDYGDSLEFRPYGMCTVMFATFEESSDDD